MRRTVTLIPLIVAVAISASACASVSPLAYLSINRTPAPLADGESVSATAGSGSAASAAMAVPTGIDLNMSTIDLTARSKVTIDLSGSWLVWTPSRFNQTASGGWAPARLKPEWACPSGTWAWFQSWDMLVPELSDLLAATTGAALGLMKQATAWSAPFRYGLQCATAFDGKTLTLDTPALPKSQSKTTWLYVTTTTSALQPWLFRLQNGTTLEAPAAGMPIQATAWMKVNLKEAEPAAPAAPAAASTAPTARLIARSTPASTTAGSAMGEFLWREVDARTSTDPGGTALTYSWDLNGDGVYGDQPAVADAWVTVPTGVAIVPHEVLGPLVATSGAVTVGVKVTNAKGQSSTATTTLRPIAFAAVTTSKVELSTEAPVAGAAVDATFTSASFNVLAACVDYDGDGAYESSFALSGYDTQTRPFTALPAGPHVITTAFADSVANCTASPFNVFRVVYISSAPAGKRLTGGVTRASGYSAATSIRLSQGRTLRESRKAPGTLRLDGAVFGGSYRWSTPRRGNGATRPGALAAFARGAYVARAGTMTVVGGAANQVGVGTGTMLLRGAGADDLLCATIAAPGPQQKTVLLGGTGAGARLRGTLVGDGFMMPFDALGVVGVSGSGKKLQPEFGQVKPFTNRATLSASTGAARALPKACRALVRYLPKIGGGGGSTTPSVVTG